MGSQNCRQQQYALDLADKSRRRSAPRAHNLIEVSPQTILDAEPYIHQSSMTYDELMHFKLILSDKTHLVKAYYK